MRVVFMGTPDFSVGTLEAIVEAGHEVAAVVTQPDKPKGRGKTVQFTPVKEKAMEYGFPVYQPQRAREESFVEELRKLQPEVIVVVAFGQILPKAILEMPKYGCINVHASLLPKYRGAAPIQWAVIDGEKESGVTTMQMNEGIDTGDILLMKKIPIEEKETGGSLFDKLAAAGAQLLVETLEQVQQGSIQPVPQDHSIATHAKMLDKTLGDIDFKKSAVEIERLIRGLNPWPSAYTRLNGKTLKIWDANVRNQDMDGKPGEVVFVSKDEIFVKTKEGLLELVEIQLEGKKRMTTDTFLRGYSLEKGTMLGE